MRVQRVGRAAAVVFAIAAVGPAGAAASSAHRGAPNHRIDHSTSTNWSGYDVTGSGGAFSSVSSSWVQPAVNCAAVPNSYSSFWVGIDGDTTSTVEQTGTDSDCSGSTPVYYAWYEMYPKFPVNLSSGSYPVAVGDTLSATVTYVGSGSFHLAISDSTRGWSFSTVQRLKSAKRGSAEVIAEAPSGSGGVLALADFGSLGFSSATVNGAGMGSFAQLDPITMQTSSGVVKAYPSAFSGGGFTDTWAHQ